ISGRSVVIWAVHPCDKLVGQGPEQSLQSVRLFRFEQATRNSQAHLRVVCYPGGISVQVLWSIRREFAPNVFNCEKFGICAKRIAECHSEKTARSPLHCLIFLNLVHFPYDNTRALQIAEGVKRMIRSTDIICLNRYYPWSLDTMNRA